MYNSDKPIEKFEEDILGRAVFAKNLGQAILEFNTMDNITIGLYGKWGTGKTSIINLAIKQIIDLTQHLNKGERPTIIKFEPWNFNSNDNLIIQFFKQLKYELRMKENKGTSKQLGEALEAYSEAISFVESIPQIGKFASLFKITAKFTGDQLKNRDLNVSIADTKDRLIRELKKQKKKIIVIIDDIDRLTNE